MSGRLVILPKKSYCPWKPENVERVLRDERLEKERLEKAISTSTGNETERLAILRRRTNDSNSKTSSPSRLCHINLFQQEEDEQFRLKGIAKRSDHAHHRDRQSLGVAPVLLGQSELESRGDHRPFYLRLAADGPLPPKEEQRKDHLDPMKDFVRNGHSIATPCKSLKLNRNDTCDGADHDFGKQKRKIEKRSRNEGCVNYRRQRRQKARETNSPPYHGAKESVESLRQRRLEREAIESQRTRAIALDVDDDRKRSYHNQYNPGRSRC